MGKILAEVGSFAMRADSRRGIHIFEYEPEQAVFTPLAEGRPQINAGQSAYHPQADVLYITDENRTAGGGSVYALRLDHETGKPEWLNERATLATLPSYICITASGNYAVVPHHANGAPFVTKTVRTPNGGYQSRLECDDATLVLIRLREDGSLGEICDVWWPEPERLADGTIRRMPHLHCCVQSPDGSLFLVCDKGLDRVHVFRIDEKQGRLIFVGSTACSEGAHPRYGVFHPTASIFYQNNERSAFLNVWKYDSASGGLELLQVVPLLEDEAEAAAWTQEGASDLRLTADGRYLYAAVRGLNVLTAFAVQGDGTLRFLQNISCNGKNPRGIALSPDERWFFAVNRDTANIVHYRRNEDGTLTDVGVQTQCELPANLRFFVY